MEQFLSQFVNGVQIGTIYALIALGYTLVYGIIQLINFAHGDLIMLGAYTAFISVTSFGLPFPAAFVLAMVVCGIANVLIERIAYKPLRDRPRLVALITAVGVSLLLENGGRVVPFIGPTYRRFPEAIAARKYYLTSTVFITNIHILNVAAAASLMLILHYVITNTKIGMAMRATALDREAAKSVGIDTDLVISITFAIGGTLAGAAGVLWAVVYPRLNPYMGLIPGLKAFVAAVFGGIGSIPGAVVGGLIMGLVEVFATVAHSQLAEGVFFIILIGILLLRPTGLLGRPFVGRA
ncbi:MAG: branched-chain amino acid ABC transporter permease [Chloroflexi bacterium]|nr:branched-chain amino acid ABC transporter permease [Chloroflexota bacterium]